MNSLPKSKKITVSGLDGTDEQILVVSKMPLGRYAEFLIELEKIPKTLAGIVKLLFGNEQAETDIKQGIVEDGIKPEPVDEISNDVMLEVLMSLPGILIKHWDDLIKLLSIASGIPEEEIKKIDLDEAVQVAMVVVEVNNFFGIKDRYQTLLEKVAISEQQKKTAVQAKKK